MKHDHHKPTEEDGVSVVYNEFDQFAAAWLRELIQDNLIAQGTVDARDIRDIVPTELVGHRQVHLFAGIGVWSLALRLAGVPDDAEVWTASCPCQPFSSAGKRGGTADERHLWPAAFHLIRHCRPRVVMGEQVASPDGLAWLDVVLADLEAEGYATRAVDTCAAGVGAPHIRQRLYWVADAGRFGDAGWGDAGDVDEATRGAPSQARQRERMRDAVDDGGATDGLADADDQGPQGRREPGRERAAERAAGTNGVACGLADPAHERRERGGPARRGRYGSSDGDDAGGVDDTKRNGATCANAPKSSGNRAHDGLSGQAGSVGRPGPTNGLWRDPDWLLCRDAKWRPVEPGTFPLAHAGAVRNRVGMLRGAGNAINVAQAAAFIQANGDVI